ncbi:hypothetical protein [Romboutsia sp.]|uniref:hypothetical protein n=1 Tax=Romboutsia sp. TaxID=1965302 RepID=UPI003F378B51
METFYRKVLINGKNYYRPVVSYDKDMLHEGIWLVAKKPGISSITSMIYKIGDIDYADVRIHANLAAHNDQIATYLSKLTDNTTEEHKDAKELLGDWFNTPSIYNISMHDLAALILRKLAILTQNNNK